MTFGKVHGLVGSEKRLIVSVHARPAHSSDFLLWSGDLTDEKRDTFHRAKNILGTASIQPQS